MATSDLNRYQRVFPFTPDNTDWQTFNGNLIMYYGQELIPITAEDNWQVTARNIIQTPAFSSYNIPAPDAFLSWVEWAKHFVMLINGAPSNRA